MPRGIPTLHNYTRFERGTYTIFSIPAREAKIYMKIGNKVYADNTIWSIEDVQPEPNSNNPQRIGLFCKKAQ
jgi:hypothetical protein